MNNTNTPTATPWTKRKAGFYRVKKKDKWQIAEWDPSLDNFEDLKWVMTGSRMQVTDLHWDEIDETPIEPNPELENSQLKARISEQDETIQFYVKDADAARQALRPVQLERNAALFELKGLKARIAELEKLLNRALIAMNDIGFANIPSKRLSDHDDLEIEIKALLNLETDE